MNVTLFCQTARNNKKTCLNFYSRLHLKITTHISQLALFFPIYGKIAAGSKTPTRVRWSIIDYHDIS